MGKLTYVFVLSLSCLSLVHGAFKAKKLPSYILPCSASAPDLSKCVVLHGRQSIPHLLKGDPKYKLPPLLPYHLNVVELQPTDRLTLALRNIKVYGLDNVEIRDADFDLKKKHIKIDLYAKSVRIEANYSVNGQLLIIPISGDGPAVFQFGDCFLEYEIDYDLRKRGDGKTYISNMRPKLDFRVSKAHYQLDNLFNGNQQLGESTNQILNDNPQEVLKDFKEVISQTVIVIANDVVSAYLNVIPYDEIFLP